LKKLDKIRQNNSSTSSECPSIRHPGQLKKPIAEFNSPSSPPTKRREARDINPLLAFIYACEQLRGKEAQREEGERFSSLPRREQQGEPSQSSSLNSNGASASPSVCSFAFRLWRRGRAIQKQIMARAAINEAEVYA
jgi:hypothetical protein